MKAAIINRTGPASELRVSDVPIPEPESGEIRVKVAAAAVNPVDIKTRSGFLKSDLNFPAILGWDVAGAVDAIGADVSRFHVGDQVMGMVAQPVRGQGTYAEYLCAPEELFASVPTGLGIQEAAAVPLTVLTAAQMLSKLNLPDDNTPVLVTGAAGAVGRVAVQWLLQAGHRVAGLARLSDTDDLVALGVETVYDSTTEIPVAAFDAVIDTAGIPEAISNVRDDGKFVSITDNTQPQPERGIIPMKSYVQENGQQLAEIADQVAQGKLSVPAGPVYPLTQVANAHADFEYGGIRGKVLLIP